MSFLRFMEVSSTLLNFYQVTSKIIIGVTLSRKRNFNNHQTPMKYAGKT
ncbi:hypothetical protein [Nonlabens antarcticus]|nr:hypothetical protein [Nonlabens antarcticus]